MQKVERHTNRITAPSSVWEEVWERRVAAVSKGSMAKARRRRAQASLEKHKVTAALV